MNVFCLESWIRALLVISLTHLSFALWYVLQILQCLLVTPSTFSPVITQSFDFLFWGFFLDKNLFPSMTPYDLPGLVLLREGGTFFISAIQNECSAVIWFVIPQRKQRWERYCYYLWISDFSNVVSFSLFHLPPLTFWNPCLSIHSRVSFSTSKYLYMIGTFYFWMIFIGGYLMVHVFSIRPPLCLKNSLETLSAFPTQYLLSLRRRTYT